MKLEHPKTLKQLRSFMRRKYTSSYKVHPESGRNNRTPLLKKRNNKHNRLNWTEKHSKAFEKIKQKIKQLIENKHFDTTKKTRMKCDASNNSIVAIIEQKHDNVWHTIAFASRLLNNYENRDSTKEIELMAVVWAVQHFKNYLHSQEFKLLTDHQAY